VGNINVYSAKRYVIGIRTSISSKKLFQIVFAKDGSLFVTFPYYCAGAGRLGLVELNPNLEYPTSLDIGKNFLATVHYVKYSHHPTGRAHFSLSGKTSSKIGKQSVPLTDVNGHLFTVMIQGFNCFNAITTKDKGDKDRGVVIFSFDDVPVKATKFLGMLYPERTIKRIVRHHNESAWMKVVAPDGSIRIGLLLDTPILRGQERYFLMLTAESIETICAQQEVFISLLGGFDAPSISLEHQHSTSFLMFIYPNNADFRALVQQFGTIDLPQ
jgi:hypothetical protein